MVSFDESNIEEEIAELKREIAAKGNSKQGELTSHDTPCSSHWMFVIIKPTHKTNTLKGISEISS